MESTEVSTSVDQPTTLVIKLPDDYEAEVVWKRDGGETVNHSVLPDGSLYIVNTDMNDQGEYTVIVSGDNSVGFEKLELTVVDPQLPTGLETVLHVSIFIMLVR